MLTRNSKDKILIVVAFTIMVRVLASLEWRTIYADNTVVWRWAENGWGVASGD